MKLSEVEPVGIARLSNDELFKLALEFGRAWMERPLPEGLNREEFVNRLIFVLQELGARGLRRPASVPDVLGVEVKEASHPIHHEECLKLLQALPESVVVQEDAIRVGGPFPGSGDGPVDVWVGDSEPDASRDLKLLRLFQKLVGTKARVRLDQPGRDDAAATSAFDLALKRKPSPEYRVIREDAFAAHCYESSGSDESPKLPEFVWVPDFISVSGSYVYRRPDRKPNDIDLIVRSDEPDPVIVEALSDKVRTITGLRPEFHWEPRGPNWTYMPAYDLVFSPSQPHLEESRQRALKVPDPDFIVERLRSGREVILLSSVSRSYLAGQHLVLLNERLKEGEPTKAWGVVSFEEDGQVGSFEELGGRARNLDPLSRRESAARKGPFWILVLKLVEDYRKPIQLRSTPPGRRYSTSVDVDAMRVTEALRTTQMANFFAIRDGKAVDLGSTQPDGLQPMPGRRWAIVVQDIATGHNRAAPITARTPVEANRRTKQEARRIKNPGLIVIGSEAVGINQEGEVVFQQNRGFTFFATGVQEAVDAGGESPHGRDVRSGNGDHRHPHGPDGEHRHPGGEGEGSGGHSHLGMASGSQEELGAHSHHPEDPLEGMHLNHPQDDGSHEHLLALAGISPELDAWRHRVVELHAGPWPWIEGHSRTLIQVINHHSEPAEPSPEDWITHLLMLHSSGMHRPRHSLFHVNPETMTIRMFFEMEDGSVRLATEQDFEAEERWFSEHLPFPSVAAQEAWASRHRETSELHESIKVGDFFRPQKPVYGYREPQGREEAWDEFVRPALDAGYEVGSDTKRDGIRILAHRFGNEVRLFTEKKGVERSKYLPSLRDSMLKLPIESVILDLELELWKDGKPGIRREFAPKLAVQTESEVPGSGEGELRAYVHDVLWLDGKSLVDKPYRDRLAARAKVLPDRSGVLIPLKLTVIKNRSEFDRAVESAFREPGSEGAMLKILTGPKSIVRGPRSLGLAKLKIVSNMTVKVIGRRKQPNSFKEAGLEDPKEPITGSAALIAWRRLTRDEKTWLFRCAIRNEGGELQEINSRGEYMESDLQLRWVPAGANDPVTGERNSRDQGEWRGTDDPKVWDMAPGWPKSRVGLMEYGKTFAVALDPAPALGDLLEVEVGELQEWRDPGTDAVRWSWTFPTPIEVVPEKRPPDRIDTLRGLVRFRSEVMESDAAGIDKVVASPVSAGACFDA